MGGGRLLYLFTCYSPTSFARRPAHAELIDSPFTHSRLLFFYPSPIPLSTLLACLHSVLLLQCCLPHFLLNTFYLFFFLVFVFHFFGFPYRYFYFPVLLSL